MGTLMHRIETEEEWRSPEVVKVACNRHGEALYFSRSPLPFQRAFDPRTPLFRHIGIYAFRPAALSTFVSLKPSPLEIAESLEQLRALEYGAVHPADRDQISLPRGRYARRFGARGGDPHPETHPEKTEESSMKYIFVTAAWSAPSAKA